MKALALRCSSSCADSTCPHLNENGNLVSNRNHLLHLPHLRGEVQRRHARLVRNVHVGVCVEQQPRCFDVAEACGVVQGGTAVALRAKCGSRESTREKLNAGA